MSHPAENDAPHPALIDEVGDSYIAGLETERAHAVERGDADRVADVDAELERVGASVPAQVEQVGEAVDEQRVEVEGDTLVETAEESAPVEKAVPSKPRRSRK